MKFELIEVADHDEFYGPMTYIRRAHVGEHIQDDNGLILHMCGFYPEGLMNAVLKAVEEYYQYENYTY